MIPMTVIQEEEAINLLNVLKPVTISWHDINVFTRKSKPFYKKWSKSEVPSKQIIRNVSGEAKAGQLLAIMGSSGAGKTTLLNVLNSRNLSKLKVKGEVRLNGRTADANAITSVSAYVQQMDVFLPNLTVREHLTFQVLLKMDQKCTQEERNVRIEQLLNRFSLVKCADTRIGNKSMDKGISGGEAKRLTFASELLTNPSLMFCDEPTTGLDSFMATNVMKTLKQMSSEGRTIICTIHQPSSQVFALFEQLLLMSEGRVAYMGAAKDAVTFFSSLGINSPQNYNPSDFFIEELAIIPSNEEECKKKINNICDKYLESTHCQLINGFSTNQTNKKMSNEEKNNSFKLKYKTDFWHQLSTIFWRSFLTILREPKISQIRIIQMFVVALILGTLYWDQDLDQRGVMNISGALFILIANMTFSNSLAVINTFCEEIPVFLREHHNGLYRADVYFLSKNMAELPIFTALPVVYMITYYFMVGLNPEFSKFLIALLITWLIVQCSISFGYLMSCMSSSATMAASICGPVQLPMMLFAGYTLNSESIPDYLIWLKYISWFYYGFESLIINQWKDIDYISCPQPFTNLTQSANSSQAIQPSIHCWNTGKDVIKQFDFDGDNLTRNIFLLIIIAIVIKILALIALYFKSKNR